MPSIPLIDPPMPGNTGGGFERQQPHQINPVRANPGLLNAKYQAASSLGGAISDIGELGFRVKAVADGATVQDAGTQVNAGLQEYMQELDDPTNTENGDESTFEKRWDEKLKGIKTAIADDPKVKHLSPLARQQLQRTLAQQDTKTRLAVSGEAMKRAVNRSIATFETGYDAAVQNGDLTTAIELTKDAESRGILDPRGAQQKLEAASTSVAYYTAERQLSSFRNLPPAEAALSNEEFLASITATDESGAFAVQGFGGGKLSLPARRQLADLATSRIRAAAVDMNQNAKGIAQAVKRGQPLEVLIAKGLETGALDTDTARAFAPEFMEAQDIFSERQTEKADREQAKIDRIEDKAERAAAILERERDAQATRQDRALDTMRRGLDKLTPRDIDQAEALGVTRPQDARGLSASGAAALREELSALSATERADPGSAFASLTTKMDGLMGGRFFGFLPGVEQDKSQITPDAQVALLGEIAKSGLSTPNRLALMEKFFLVRQYDLNDGEINSRAGDRQLSPAESELRSAVTKQYFKLATSFRSPSVAGESFFQHMSQIEEWFEANPKASDQMKAAQAKVMAERISKEVSDRAAGAVLSEVFR